MYYNYNIKKILYIHIYISIVYNILLAYRSQDFMVVVMFGGHVAGNPGGPGASGGLIDAGVFSNGRAF